MCLMTRRAPASQRKSKNYSDGRQIDGGIHEGSFLQIPLFRGSAGLIKNPCSDVRNNVSNIIFGIVHWENAMPDPKELIERARMFEERADRAREPISRQHYREMAAHYRSLSVEHQKKRASERELEHRNSH